MRKKTYPELLHSSNTDHDQFFKKCLHDIRNFRKLSPEILSSINNLSHEERLIILTTYNEVVSYLHSVIFNSHS